jgi:hypothetical protein
MAPECSVPIPEGLIDGALPQRSPRRLGPTNHRSRLRLSIEGYVFDGASTGSGLEKSASGRPPQLALAIERIGSVETVVLVAVGPAWVLLLAWVLRGTGARSRGGPLS